MKDYSVLLTCGEANMVIIHDAFDKGYQQGYADATIDLANEKNDRAYQQGLDDAWKAARKVTSCEGLSFQELKQIFDTASFSSIFENTTASEAVAKIKEYEEKQKQDTEIKVGDEVYSEDLDWTFIVTKIITTKYMDNTVKRYEGICTDGACYDNLPKNIVKTGRHFDEIAKVLAEMRGE